jgi:hypothetical protein
MSMPKSTNEKKQFKNPNLLLLLLLLLIFELNKPRRVEILYLILAYFGAFMIWLEKEISVRNVALALLRSIDKREQQLFRGNCKQISI